MALSACGSISNNNTTANHELAIDNRATNSVKESNRVTPELVNIKLKPHR